MKTILIIAMAFLGFAATAQEFKVVDKKPINYTAKTRIQMSFEKVARTQKDFLVQMVREDVLTDTIQFKGAIDTLFANMWTVQRLFESRMSIPDTITLYKINGKFYQDSTKVDLLTERIMLVDKYNRLEDKYGELATYKPEFQIMKKRFDKIKRWEKQITGN